jgi:hypothetical protein
LFTHGKYPMFSLANNLVKIAEGIIVSYIEDPDNY